jgi:hypothetical protein
VIRQLFHRFAIGAAVAAAPVPLAAQGALPDGRTVINRFIEAIGGRDAIMQQGGRHAKGTFAVPAQGLTGDLEIYAQPPNRLHVRIAIPGIGEILSGFDGTTAWSINPMMGPMVLDSLELRQTKQQADYYANLYPDSIITSLETVADTTFDDVPCYKVKVVTAWGEDYYEFFAKDSGLQVGSVRTIASPMGSVESTTIVSDWRELDGLKAPFKQVQRAMGMEQRFTMDTVESMTVPDSIFALPPSIQALIKQ